MDQLWAAVLGTEVTSGQILQDKSLLPTFPVPLRDSSAALHTGLHSQPLSCSRPHPWCPFLQ